MSRRKRILVIEEDFHKNEIEEITVDKAEKGLRKRQQVKYYESSSSEEDIDVKIIEPKRSKRPRNEGSSSNTSDSDFESDDSSERDDSEETQKKNKSNQKGTGKSESSSHKKGNESVSEYEKEMMEKKINNLEFLKSIGMDEAKDDFLDLKPKRKVRVKKEPSESSNGPKRVSQREKEHVDFTEFFRPVRDNSKNEELETFKKVLRFKNDYPDFVKDFSEMLEGDDILQTPVLYNKDVLKKLSEITDVHSSKVYRPAEMTWYPSSEHLILAIAESDGCLSLCNFQESNYVYKFHVHTKKISNVQFNPHNTFQLLSSSLDGSLMCGDMQKQIFNKVLKTSHCCTYFDIVSPYYCLVSLVNGKVLIVDRRSRYNEYKSYVLHDSAVNTIQVHPVEKNYCVTSGTDRKVCIWDLRKLSREPLIESNITKSVALSFFSPLSGKYLLVVSRDNKISIFDTARMTEGRMTLRTCFKNADRKKKLSTINMPTWLPNSDETFAWCNKNTSGMLQIYDKDFKVHDTIQDGIQGIRTKIKFHPFKPALASVTCTQAIRISASTESPN